MTLSPGSEISAIGVYAWFHLSALQKATRLATESSPRQQRQALARAMMADEAFALHFLEDTLCRRPCRRHLGRRLATQGHARLLQRRRPGSLHLEGRQRIDGADGGRAHAARGCRARGQRGAHEPGAIDRPCGRPRCTARVPYTPAAPASPTRSTSARTNVRATRTGVRVTPEAFAQAARGARATPVPGLGPGLGSMPRFRAEVGPFVGFAGAMDCARVDGGYDPTVTDDGSIAGAELSLRAGLGLDGVLGESGDGLVFVSLGVRGDTGHPTTQPVIVTRPATQPAACRRSARASASRPGCACRST